MFRRNRYLVIDNILKLCHEIEFNLINPLPTYHFEKEEERNSVSVSPSPIFFPRRLQSFSPIRYQLGRKINEVFQYEDEVLVAGKRNVSPSPDPLPNGMSIKNERKRSRPFNFEFPEAGIYYINPDFFGFHRRLAPRKCLPDNLYFERLRYLEIPQ
jgi:hypothetical protein